MTWQDRQKIAAYTPNDTSRRFEFHYENVSRTTDKRTTAFSFPGINDNYIQDNGYGSRQYALRCIFWGDDCDIVATGFEDALLNFGVGKLEHPLYGTFEVVPFGRISRRDDLVTAANQAIVDVTFWTTTGVVYPTSEASPENEVRSAIKDYQLAQEQAFADTIKVDAVSEQQTLRGDVEGTLSLVNSALRKPAEATEKVTREFRAWQQTINTGINVLVGNPALLAQQLVNLILAPARAVIGIQNRLASYVQLITSTFSTNPAQPWLQVGAAANPKRQTEMINGFRTADLTAQASLVAMALSCVEATFETKPQALSTAEALLAELAAVAAWREQGYAAFTLAEYGARIDALDDGVAWRQTTNTVSLCAGYLVEISFTLAAERVTKLDRARTIIDVASEFYGGVDEYLDFLIESNDLTGSEILELPKDTELLWYPQ